MTNASIDRDTFAITFQRVVRASREDVFDAWTKPEEVSEWWDPAGRKLAACEIDLRVGGAFRFLNEGHGLVGVYKVVDRPAELVFEANGSVGTVRITDDGDGTTKVDVTIRCASAEQLEQMLAMGVGEGTGRTLDNLVRYLS